MGFLPFKKSVAQQKPKFKDEKDTPSYGQQLDSQAIWSLCSLDKNN